MEKIPGHPAGCPCQACTAGTYKDSAIGLPDEERLPLRAMPRGPDPTPLANVRKLAGGR